MGYRCDSSTAGDCSRTMAATSGVSIAKSGNDSFNLARRRSTCLGLSIIVVPMNMSMQSLTVHFSRFRKAVLRPPHLSNFVGLGATWSLNLYGGALGLADQSAR